MAHPSIVQPLREAQQAVESDFRAEHAVQDLSAFSVFVHFRGKPAWFVQLWWIVHATLFRLSPQFFFGWRRFLVRLFGGKIGKGVLLRPTVKITYPWKVS